MTLFCAQRCSYVSLSRNSAGYTIFFCESDGRILLAILYKKDLKNHAAVVKVLHIMFKLFTMMLNSNAQCSKTLTIILERSPY